MGQSKELYGMTQPVSIEEQKEFIEFNKYYHNSLEVRIPTITDEDEAFEYQREMDELNYQERMVEYFERGY
jgi:hypothetical protein